MGDIYWKMSSKRAIIKVQKLFSRARGLILRGQKKIKTRKIVFLVALSVILCAGVAFSAISNVTGSDNSYVASASQLSAPSISVKASGYEGLSISWKSVSGAKSYQVYRSTSESGTFKKVATTSKKSYLDKKINQNEYYYYKVKAVASNSTSAYSNVKSARINTKVNPSKIKAYSSSPYVKVNNNIPKFSKRMLTKKSYESYSEFDSLGRCGVAISCIGKDLMPTEDRGSIGMIKPSGWHTVRYDDLVDGKYLYNRCHLIGYQLTGENANERNLITGTRYLNVEGMLPFENEVADYIKDTGNHVLYRVTPIFSGKNLVCSGVQMEAYSVEDSGNGICFNIYCYNVQPGVEIDYATGDSWRAGSTSASASSGHDKTSSKDSSYATGGSNSGSGSTSYVLNTNTKKFHKPTCSSVNDMKAKNRKDSNLSRSEIIAMGYDPCKRCNP